MKSKGFSLIEVLITLVILSISLLALASLMAMTTRNNSFGSHVTEAATFAQDKLEELRVTSWGNLPPFSGSDQRSGSTGINYTRNWSVNPNPPSLNDTLRTITITVTWNDRVNHSIRLLSVISQ
jgi:type IV pilus assembly protein PilV